MAAGDAVTTEPGNAFGPGLAAPSVVIRDLHVTYKVFEEQRLSLHELARRKFRSRRTNLVHAVRGVDLTFHHGEAIGLVGTNGSGKSTLLRTIAGLERVASGSVYVSAQAQFLGVGAALDPLLSGYRNIFIGGLAMGLSRDEVESHLDEVIEFSGIGDAIGRPLRTYSSGMRSRLAFSIATMRAPEILLIDEALAVGDRGFRRRGLQRINELKSKAGTIVMVSHNHNEIRRTCSRSVWLDMGTLRADGPTDEVLAAYEAEYHDDEPGPRARAANRQAALRRRRALKRQRRRARLAAGQEEATDDAAPNDGAPSDAAPSETSGGSGDDAPAGPGHERNGAEASSDSPAVEDDSLTTDR